jgi:hypothetical protein
VCSGKLPGMMCPITFDARYGMLKHCQLYVCLCPSVSMGYLCWQMPNVALLLYMCHCHGALSPSVQARCRRGDVHLRRTMSPLVCALLPSGQEVTVTNELNAFKLTKRMDAYAVMHDASWLPECNLYYDMAQMLMLVYLCALFTKGGGRVV